MIEAGMRGKGVIVLHTYRDQLWWEQIFGYLYILQTLAVLLVADYVSDVIYVVALSHFIVIHCHNIQYCIGLW